MRELRPILMTLMLAVIFGGLVIAIVVIKMHTTVRLEVERQALKIREIQSIPSSEQIKALEERVTRLEERSPK